MLFFLDFSASLGFVGSVGLLKGVAGSVLDVFKLFVVELHFVLGRP